MADHTSELLAALKLLIERSGHMSPFGSEISVKGVRKAGKYMEALEAAEKLITKVEASTLTSAESTPWQNRTTPRTAWFGSIQSTQSTQTDQQALRLDFQSAKCTTP